MTRLATVAAAVALVAVAAACSGSSAPASGSSSRASASSGSAVGAPGAPGPPASVAPGDPAKPIAVVDGVLVTEASFNDELNAVGSVPSYLDYTDLQLAPGNVATRLPSGTFDPGYLRSLLRRRILLALVEHELQVRGVAVDDACRAEAAKGIPAELAGGDTQAGQAFLDAFPPSYRDQLVVWNAEVKQLQSTLSGLPCDTTDPSAQSRIGTAYATWLDATLPTATISVDPAYGTWDLASGSILPPGGTAASPSSPTTSPSTTTSSAGG